MDKVKIVTDIVETIVSRDLMSGIPLDLWVVEISEAYDMGCLYYLYDGDRLQGFVQAFRLDKEPKTQEEACQLFAENPSNTGKIGVIINCVKVEGTHTVAKLFSMVKESNPVWDVVVWHRRANGKFMRFENTKDKQVDKQRSKYAE